MRGIIIIGLILLCSSCRELVQDEFDSFENKICVNSILSTDKPVNIHLSTTDELNDCALAYLEDAVIEMYNQDSIFLNFTYSGDGQYSSDYSVKEGDVFNLKIKNANESIGSSCEIPEHAEILDFYVNKNAWVDETGHLQPEAHFTIKNQTGESQFYEAYVIIYDSTASYVEEEYPILYFDNEGESENTITKDVKIEMQSFSYPPIAYKYELIIKSLDRNFYEYINSIEDYLPGRYPNFSSISIVPLNLYSNIENGYGIFCGYSYSKSKMIEENH